MSTWSASAGEAPLGAARERREPRQHRVVEGALGVGQVGVRRWPGGPKERSVGAHQAPHGSGGPSTGDSGRGLRGGEHATDGFSFDNWRSMSR